MEGGDEQDDNDEGDEEEDEWGEEEEGLDDVEEEQQVYAPPFRTLPGFLCDASTQSDEVRCVSGWYLPL